MNISEVAQQLKGEFPDLTVSKIRFLETAGLLNPKRTKSGYRVFSEPDVKKLRFILRAQRDNFLPLNVIRRRISEGEYNIGDEIADSITGKQAVPVFNGKERRITRDELIKISGCSREFVNQLEHAGLVFSDSKNRDYFQTDAEIIKSIKNLLRMGLELRHIKIVESAAAREAELSFQIVSPILKSRGKNAAAEKVSEFAENTEKFKKLIFARLLSSQL